MALLCRCAFDELLLVIRDLLHTCVGAHLHHHLHQRRQKRSNEPCSVGERLSTVLHFLYGMCTSALAILPSGHEREAIFSPNRNFLWCGDHRVKTASCAGKWRRN